MRVRFGGTTVVLIFVGLTFGSGCASRRAKADANRTAQFIAADQVYAKAQQELAQKNLRKARQTLEKVVYSPEDRSRLEPLVRIGLADSMFYLGDDLSLIEARAKYQDFVTLFGDHSLAPYAGYQAGVCSLKQVRAPARDQTETKMAIGDLRDVTRRWPNAPFARAASDAIVDAETNLAEHEFLIGRFYLQRKKYVAAAERFRQLNETYPHYKAKDRLYLNLGKALYMAEGQAAAQAWFDRLFTDYPNSKPAEDAKSFLAKSAPKPKDKSAKPKTPEPPTEAPAATTPPPDETPNSKASF